MNLKILGDTREFAWVSLGLALPLFFLLAGTKVLTSLLSAAEYGKLALALSLANFAVQIGATPIAATFLRFYHTTGEPKNPLYNTLKWPTGAVFAAIVLLSFGAYLATSNNLLGVSTILILSTSALTIMLCLNRLFIAFLDAKRARPSRAKNQSLLEASRFLIAISLILITGLHSAETALIGFFAAIFFLNLFNYRKLLSNGFFRIISRTNDTLRAIKSKKNREIYAYLKPLFASNFFIWCITTIDRWVIGHFGSLADVGGFFAIHQISFIPMAALSNLLVILTGPIIFQATGSGSIQKSQAIGSNFKLVIFIVLTTITLTVFSVLFHDPIVQLLLGSSFHVYSWILPWLVFSGGCFAASQQLSINFLANYESSAVARIWGVTAIIAVTLYIAGMKVAGLAGIVYSLTITNTLLLLLSIVSSVNKTPRVN